MSKVVLRSRSGVCKEQLDAPHTQSSAIPCIRKVTWKKKIFISTPTNNAVYKNKKEDVQ